ncbi:MAG: hypothetical protein PVI26_02115 [Chitinispirillia bacterium]|jgi:hypothetical protein
MGKKRQIKANIQKRAKEFWEWFQKNEPEIFNFKNNQDTIFKSLSEKLCSVHPSLGFAFHEQIQEGKREIIFSPNGDKVVIPFLNILYELRPELERWHIILYKPRIPISDCLKPIEVKNTVFNPEEIKFVLFAKDTLIYIIFFVEGYEDKQKKESIQTCVIILLDQLIGEYNAMTKIGDVMIQPADTPLEKGKKYHLKYLPLAFDETLKKIEHRRKKQARSHD